MVEENFIKVVKFMNDNECKCSFDELIDFMDNNDIFYMIFMDTLDIFDYYDEDYYICKSFEYCVFMRDGRIIKITD